MSVTTAGRMATERPERYLKQLCSHLGSKFEATHEGGEGRIVLGVIGSHLERFGEKEGLTFEWDDAGHAAAAAAARAEHLRTRQAQSATRD